MNFQVTILGCSSAIPTKDRFPTAQMVQVHDRLILVDCAEGTQMQLRRYRFPLQRIHTILISHLHADHFLGLPGLISTMNLLGRNRELSIYGPPGLKTYIDLYNSITEQTLRFKIHWYEIQFGQEQLLFEMDLLKITSFPVKHSIPCVGFIFQERKRQPNIRKEAIIAHQITVPEIKNLKAGIPLERNGINLPMEEVVQFPPEPRTYVYMTDTSFLPELAPKFTGVDLLYHEATFASDFAERAEQTDHSTATQAGTFARMAQVKKLIIGHFSVRYKKLNVLLDEARMEFPNTELAEDGKTFYL